MFIKPPPMHNCCRQGQMGTQNLKSQPHKLMEMKASKVNIMKN